MKLTLKRADCIELFLLIAGELPKLMEERNDSGQNKRYSFAVNFNKETLLPLYKSFSEINKTKVKGYEGYRKERKEILKSCAVRDENGIEVIGRNGNPIIKKEHANKINFDIEKLKELYKDDIKARELEVEEIGKILDEVIEVDLCQVSYADLPDFLDERQSKIMRMMVMETDEEIKRMLVK